MEQNQEPRNDPLPIQPIFDKGVKKTQWRKDSLSVTVLGKLDNHIQKNKMEPISNHLQTLT